LNLAQPEYTFNGPQLPNGFLFDLKNVDNTGLRVAGSQAKMHGLTFVLFVEVPFQESDGFIIHLDGCRFLPDNMTFSRVSLPSLRWVVRSIITRK
jgi:hypothetical protein